MSQTEGHLVHTVFPMGSRGHRRAAQHALLKMQRSKANRGPDEDTAHLIALTQEPVDEETIRTALAEAHHAQAAAAAAYSPTYSPSSSPSKRKSKQTPPLSPSPKQWRAKPTATAVSPVTSPAKRKSDLKPAGTSELPVLPEELAQSAAELLEADALHVGNIVYEREVPDEVIVYTAADIEPPHSTFQKVTGMTLSWKGFLPTLRRTPFADKPQDITLSEETEELIDKLSIGLLGSRVEELLGHVNDETQDSDDVMFLPGKALLNKEGQRLLLNRAIDEGHTWRSCQVSKYMHKLQGDNAEVQLFVAPPNEGHGLHFRYFEIARDGAGLLADFVNTLTEGGLLMILWSFRMVCCHSIEAFLRAMHRNLECARNGGCDEAAKGSGSSEEEEQEETKEKEEEDTHGKEWGQRGGHRCMVGQSKHLVYNAGVEIALVIVGLQRIRTKDTGATLARYLPACILQEMMRHSGKQAQLHPVYKDIQKVSELMHAEYSKPIPRSEAGQLRHERIDACLIDAFRELLEKHSMDIQSYAQYTLSHRAILQLVHGLLFAAYEARRIIHMQPLMLHLAEKKQRQEVKKKTTTVRGESSPSGSSTGSSSTSVSSSSSSEDSEEDEKEVRVKVSIEQLQNIKTPTSPPASPSITATTTSAESTPESKHKRRPPVDWVTRLPTSKTFTHLSRNCRRMCSPVSPVKRQAPPPQLPIPIEMAWYNEI